MQLQDAYRSVLTTIAQGLGRLRRFGMPGGGSTTVIVEEFRAAGAVTRRTAQRFHAHNDAELAALAWLVELEIIRQPEPGRYYLDEQSLAERNATRLFE
jgi:hypothetical protein